MEPLHTITNYKFRICQPPHIPTRWPSFVTIIRILFTVSICGYLLEISDEVGISKPFAKDGQIGNGQMMFDDGEKETAWV